MLPCPDRERLIAFLLGRLVGEEATALAGHLAECAACQARAEGSLPPDPLLAALAQKPEPSEEAESTLLSLLERLRQRPCDQTAWEEFVDLYAPLLVACVRHQGFSGADLEDLVEESLIRLFVALPGFVHKGKHSFRSWLVTIVRNRCRTHRKKRPMSSLPDGVEPVVPDTVEEWIEREWLPSLARRALQLIKQDFEPNTWQACKLLVKGLPARDVASRLGMTDAAVYTAKSRVLARLRQELDG